MKTGSGALGALASAAAIVTAFACSSSSGGSSSGDGGSGSSSGGSGAVTYSCGLMTLCNEIVGPPSAMAGEQQSCSMLMGMFGSGCSRTGVVASCDMGVGGIQFYYTAMEAMLTRSLCHGTWSAVDGGAGAEGGATGDAAFVGTWARSGTRTVTCPSGTPTTSAIMGNLVITLGLPANSIIATQPDGCATQYTVSGNVATAAPGQSCGVTTEAGIAETITETMHTLTLSADGKTLASMSSETIDKTATSVMCTATSSGTYTKL